MWEDCLWNYVFPMLDCASHMVWISNRAGIKILFFFFRPIFIDFEICAFRLRLPQKMNGKGKNLVLEEEKQFTCLYTTGVFFSLSLSLSLSMSVFSSICCFFFFFLLTFFPFEFFAFSWCIHSHFHNEMAVVTQLKNSGMRH